MQEQPIIIHPKKPANASIIWLHGLGANGYDFVDIVPELNLPQAIAARFVFPHAPLSKVTINGNMEMRAWFDIFGLTADSKQDENGIKKSQQIIEQLIANELEQGIPSNKIILAGFSQGAAMSIYTGLRYKETLGGILALSGFLPLAEQMPNEINEANKKTSIQMMHGTFDEIVQLSWAQQSYKYLQGLGCDISLQTYPMHHSLCTEEIQDIGRWLGTVLS
ncbi:MAG: dienelactone hydrolase family protein [Gammaproteobacteria bacterium]|nr:dienelactone hydrolase family protein [Gammaproteobacteria bacterium]